MNWLFGWMLYIRMLQGKEHQGGTNLCNFHVSMGEKVDFQDIIYLKSDSECYWFNELLEEYLKQYI